MTATSPADPALAAAPGALVERLTAPAVMIVAGEASGDLHGATLAHALRTLAPDATFYGMGGPKMAEAGVELIEDVTAAAAVGGTEAVGRLPRLLRVFRALKTSLTARHPDALVVIDFPEFNLRLAAAARRAGVPVVYFIPPQIWAWRGGRIAQIRRRVSLVLTVLPFEAAIYRQAGVPVEFVGHPVVDAIRDAPSRDDARRSIGASPGTTVIGLLPGSRREEVARNLPLMREAVAQATRERSRVRVVLGLAPTIDRVAVSRLVGPHADVEIVPDGAYTVMRAADVALVASGTATLETALLGTPMIVVYRLSRVSEAIIRLLVRVPWISLVNIALGREVVPELYQSTATTERLAAELRRLLDDPEARTAQQTAFAELAREAGEPGVGLRAARWVLAAASARRRR